MKKLILPPTMFSLSRHDFSAKGSWQVPWKNVVSLHTDTKIFVLPGSNFSEMIVRNLSVPEMKLTCNPLTSKHECF